MIFHNWKWDDQCNADPNVYLQNLVNNIVNNFLT